VLVIDSKNNNELNLKSEISEEIVVSRSANEVQEIDSQEEQRSRPVKT
jgi:hypothetical protein